MKQAQPTHAAATPPLRVLPTTLGDRVRSTLDETFQGREPELDRISDLLAGEHTLPHIITITGPPGIGKTALARAAERRLRREGVADVVIVDAHEFDHTPAGLAALVASRTDTWPRRTGDRPLLLVIDTYETLTIPERRRLREDFLTDLSGPVLLALCDRGQVDAGRCQLVGWRSVETRVPLGPLPMDEALAFLTRQGVSGTAALKAAVLSAGNPLLLAIAGELTSHAVEGEVPVRVIVEEAARMIIHRLRREGMDEDLRALLEAACLLPWTTEETLGTALGRDVAVLFQRLTALSIVRRVDGGHDFVAPFGRILVEDLRLRRPSWCAAVAGRPVGVMTRAGGTPIHGPDNAALPVVERRSTPRPETSSLPLDDVKQALEWVRDPSRHAACNLAATFGADDEVRLRRALADAVIDLTESKSLRVAEAGFLLREYYLRRAPSHEAIAERLGISRATLFRRLTLGLRLVAARVVELRGDHDGPP